MKLEKDDGRETLSHLIKESIFFSFETFLEKILAYASSKIFCAGGTAFLFNGATGRLDLSASTYKSVSPVSLDIEKGVAGKAYRDGTFTIELNNTSDCFYTHPCHFSEEELAAVAAIPLLQDGRVFGVLCFDFPIQLNSQYPETTDTPEIEKYTYLIQNLWKEFEANNLAFLAHQKLVGHIQARILSAGQLPSQLKEKLNEFLLNFEKVFETANWPKPDVIYIQLIDQPQKRIRTVCGYGFPLSFEYLPSHSLDSKEDDDIQASIWKSGNIEIISGNDKEFFDQRIFKQYNHQDYSRLFFPLFPYKSHKDGEQKLQNLIQWKLKEDKDKIKKTGVWSDGAAPPRGLIYGTVEVGYKTEKKSPLSLEPLGEELGLFCLENALRLGAILFPATLGGVLEEIGQLGTFFSQGQSVSLCSSIGQLREKRTYPNL